ncbi:choline dehydrogenase [Verticillium alfalfae VaMs.102]|uniref:Choline dehydrogenase n=1 Tax=Verticillium alfalfae (strain VaMs.102 / ATCC MYA-4576 / FGSC 10136) TaxID=526221 RepID=C9SIV2_VERA1|nr:choline dehydrogenase [Verticillium alfalfae VaMs.102]EEY18875.1 choline dehydrogenase [Verticillium alfalfae VaMs.102]
MSDSTTYDIIIVGGGTAGLVLAARLSDDASLRILVIEAGEDLTSDPRISMPPMWPTLLNSAANWGFRTVPQNPTKTGLCGRELAFTQGRLLGGSSAINGLSFTPTSKFNVDTWAKLGNPGWQWDDFAQSFAKCYTLPAHAGDVSGPIKLSLPNDPGNAWAGIWNQTLSNLGHAGKGDAFTGQVSGAFTNTDAIDPDTRQRSYAVNSYLEPARRRSNLNLISQASVEKITFDTSQQGQVVATGVRYNKDGEIHHVKANNEVILAAGAVNSPKILELSGVGDPQRLRSLGIESIVDNIHVGENLQNHIMCGMSFEVLEGLATMDPLARQDEASVAAAMDAYGKQLGPFASSGTNAVAQLPFPGIETAEGKSDIEQLMSKHKQEPSNLTSATPAFAEAHEDFVRSILVSQDQASACYLSFPGFAWFKPDGTMASPPSGPENYFSVALLLSHPLSRGSVHIKSSSASTDSTQVAIDPAHLTHSLDIEIMSRHLQFLETIVASEPLVDYLKPGGKRNPGANDPLTDLESAREYIKRTAVGGNHPVGTCSMMPRELGGVVDSNLRVYGCSNLRVCDASIIPILPRANLQATVYGVAEHAAGIIRGTKLDAA